MEIRDTRNGDWHWVYNAVLSDPHLFPNDKLVYSAISTFGGHQIIHPTIEQISLRCGVSERGVQISLTKLEEVGYLRVDKNTGRGNANVYYLLKSPKGCNNCTFSKECNDTQERVQSSAIKGAMAAPHIDIYKDKEKDTAQGAGNSPLVIELFKELNPSYRLLFSRKVQHDSARRLLEREGFDRLRAVISFLISKRSDKFCPQISSPYQLEEKWSALEKYAMGLRSEVKNNNIVAFV